MAVATETTYNLIEDTMMSASYAEARSWIDWIRVFTPSDLADTMVVDLTVAERFIKAAEWHGIIRNTGDFDGREYIYEYVPLPPGPRNHPHKEPPEKVVGYDEVLCARGMPIRIRTERDMRRILSTSGARSVHVRREKAYKKQQEAVALRRKKQIEKREDTRKVKPRGKKARDQFKEWWE